MESFSGKVKGVFVCGAMSLFCSLVGFCSEIPLPEHPRPDWKRAGWVNLNGPWDFGFNKGAYDQKILVPYGWAAPMSGVKGSGDHGYYRRRIAIPADWSGKRVFVVIGASDCRTTAYVDGERLNTYEGGYLPQEYELTPRVKAGEECLLEFEVWDPGEEEALKGGYLWGKQAYGNARGIWQTVYLEARGEQWLESVRFRPDLATSSVAVDVCLGAPAPRPMTVDLAFAGKTERVPFRPGERSRTVRVVLEKPHLWTLDDPFLYEVVAVSEDDRVETYFGFREVSAVTNRWNGHPYVHLNGMPVYLRMTLDQSYHPDGYCTFPSDESMRNDIVISKRLGLNGNRIHMKVEVPRKLYWADRLGLLIMADVPAAWGPASESQFVRLRGCLEGMVRRDFNHPSIFAYVLFNESWGLFTDGDNFGPRRRLGTYAPWVKRKVAELYWHAKAIDPTRLVEDNSPCLDDHVVTDINSWHGYFPGFHWDDELKFRCDQTFVGSTGNYADGFVQTGAPMMNSECGDVWGYRGGTGDCDISWNYHQIMNAFRRHPKCCGWVSTEHQDAPCEWRGYVRYDRSEKEFGIEELFPGMTLADLHADAYLLLDREIGRVYRPGETALVPVGISLATDCHVGKSANLAWFLRYYDGEGRLVQTAPEEVAPKDAELRPWRCGHLADVPVKLPAVDACGAICFALKTEGETVARNFQCFSVRPEKLPDPVRPTKAEWSVKTWDVLDGRKFCGAGKGFFEYEFPAPRGSCMFRAEVSSKRLNAKDLPGAVGVSEADCNRGRGGHDRSRNPNSYPQTSLGDRHPGRVVVSVNGIKVKAMDLPDDPADHRGVLSWMAQPEKKPFNRYLWPRADRLYEAGSYGYLLEAEIPEDVVRRSPDGRIRVRLEATDGGLAVYGREFGRFPLDPHVTGR